MGRHYPSNNCFQLLHSTEIKISVLKMTRMQYELLVPNSANESLSSFNKCNYQKAFEKLRFRNGQQLYCVWRSINKSRPFVFWGLSIKQKQKKSFKKEKRKGKRKKTAFKHDSSEKVFHFGLVWIDFRVQRCFQSFSLLIMLYMIRINLKCFNNKKVE